ncbi:hypothetical protein [Hymenobacter psychrophilus]|uniref:Uncharacterized protein n=1 Tax=Hymenobacter psychrophilus TaxID=651662 RepID=A0A1H3EQ19_9BACT|nr:hypothetical protein [Hymenobacter psychrophilus]SDX80842.1 hypothetical protein SAMN04488069_103253 [Hymenobacter psychrophilus]
MLTATIPPTSIQPVALNDELLNQPTTYNGVPAVVLLTPEEAGSGCRLYLARNDVHAPRLLNGDYLVGRPLAREEWANVAADSFALLLVQVGAADDGSWEPFQAHHVARIVGNGLRYGGSLLSLQDDEASLPEPVETAAADLVEVYQVVRAIRPL